VRIPKTVKDLNLCIRGKFIVFDATVMTFMRFLANCIMIVLSKVVFICFKHKLEVKKFFCILRKGVSSSVVRWKVCQSAMVKYYPSNNPH